MHVRSSRKVLFTVLVLGIMLFQPLAASASNTTISGDIYTGYWRFYGTQRTVSYSPWEIAVMKTDGPGMWAYMYGCGPSSGAGNGPTVYFEDPDPPYSYQWLRAGKSWGITFCLAAKSNGSDSSDTFTATLDWDG